ncbi:hypothetical protein Cgig2_030673 [Carnegiea gigantea]|uniref:Uncharacterized protein n=1 Tax=Carnegiea gigantea TaxID=171969 RepID=A0A9Q1QBN8_9CARY|nr:hypothetical protein Cgig2_030673 [Carnegiea gigantea]
MPPPSQVQIRSIDSIPGEWLPTLESQQRHNFFHNRSISVCDKLDVQFFGIEKFGYKRLIKDNCLGLPDLGDVVYPHLVWLFYANLETKMGGNGVYFVGLVNFTKITLTRSTLETSWNHVSELTTDEATTFTVHLPENSSSAALVEGLKRLCEDSAELRTRVDITQNPVLVACPNPNP